MGFNIAGLVINNNYDHDLKALSDDLNLNLTVKEEITFETASQNWKQGPDFNVYFGKFGTLIFFAHDLCMNGYQSRAHESMCFAYSATAMTFFVTYWDPINNLSKSIMESEGDRMRNDGDVLPLEAENPTADGLIFAMIDKIMEENWHGIDFGEKAYLCSVN
jgi:hypothetical protein